MNGPAAPLKGRAARLARLMPSGPSNAARTPFMLLVVVLLGGGLISLLLLNSALNEGSFRLSELRKQTTDLTDEEQALQRDVDGYSQPDALERRARELGMVPGGSPAFLNPDGTVRGVPAEVTADPLPTPVPTEAPAATEEPAATEAPAAVEEPAATEAPRAAGATGTAEAAETAQDAESASAPSIPAAPTSSPDASSDATTTPTSPGR
ncbi:septum formation initiator family protein [Streptomyces sp. NBC_00102]|uniref:FtsB family cell division protein n=1 Tax=Streptomyces sp. NBC_00102 TaxID=2975652 RepID=UPI00225A930C|nr:septum formation initiator [Streptomyces sp. NBC_00102]MCX5396499.1 septum formation initiator family protein [Streptomyces sp. NBC_00102]